MAEKLEVGQRVRFRRSHDKATELTGKIVKLHEDSDLIDVETEPDGRIAEISTTETVHSSDATLLADVQAIAEATGESSITEDSETGTESHRRRRR